MRTYKLYGTSASTADNVASVLMAKNGRIKSVRWSVKIDAVADNSAVDAELSTRATQQLSTNETQGDISAFRSHFNLVTSGFYPGSFSKQDLLDFPVAMGERIYLNIVITTATATITIYIDVDEKG